MTKHSQVLTAKHEVVQQLLKIAKSKYLNKKFHGEKNARKCRQKRKSARRKSAPKCGRNSFSNVLGSECDW